MKCTAICVAANPPLSATSASLADPVVGTARPVPASASISPLASQLRDRYLSSTNSRQWAAQLLRDLIDETGCQRVLDIGSGDGALAVKLAEVATYVGAIEPDPTMRDTLRQAALAHPELEYLPSRAEGVDLPTGAFELGLLSYVLETLPADDRDSLLTSVFELLAPEGLLVGISFVEGSAWDQYLELSKNHCGGNRYVGFGELAKALRTHGWFVSRHANFCTHIVAPDIEELFEVCAHFMGKRAPLYLDSRPTLLPVLQQLVRPTGKGAVILDITECLYSIGDGPGPLLRQAGSKQHRHER